MVRPLTSDPSRQRWRDFICSPLHAGRHLASIGRSVAASKSDPIDIDELEAFLKRLEGVSDDVAFLAAVVELIQGDYLKFLEDVLQDLLDQLSSETERQDEIVGPILKGAPRWGATLLGRLSGQLRPGLYYSRTAHRAYDIPENRVVRLLIDEIGSVVDGLFARTKGRGVPEPIVRMRAACEALQDHPVLREIEPKSDFQADDLDEAEASVRREYREAASLCRSICRLTQSDPDGRWHAILMLLSVNWLEPVSDDDLFELYILVLVIDVLSSDLGLGSVQEFGLVAAGRRHVAKFDSPKGDVSVFFDLSMRAILGSRGRYSKLVSDYDGVSGSERRPDIVVMRKSPGEYARPLVALVEVKRSESETYISDSIYKAFGYLHDYQSIWQDMPFLPRIVLAVPGPVSIKVGRPYLEVGVVSGDDRESLSRMLAASLDL